MEGVDGDGGAEGAGGVEGAAGPEDAWRVKGLVVGVCLGAEDFGLGKE